MEILKKIFILLFLFCIFFIKKIEVNAGTFYYNNFQCNDNSSIISIEKYRGDEETIIIPSCINGKQVMISSYAFKNCDTIKSVIIEKGIHDIASEAFRDCINLESISLPDELFWINHNAFQGCYKLKTINIPSSVETIYSYAFKDCKSLESVIITNKNTSINLHCFDGCSLLTIYADSNSNAKNYAEVNKIPFSCINHTIIADAAISPTCTEAGLTEGSHCPVCGEIIKKQEIIPSTGHKWDNGTVTKESTTTNVGEKTYTCTVCKATKTEVIPKINTPIENVPTATNTPNTETESVVDTSNQNNAYTDSKSETNNVTIEYVQTDKSKTIVEIPDTVIVDGTTCKVTTIAKNAFKNNKKLKKVVIGNNIKKIDSNAFYGCKNLKEIIIESKSLTYVGKNVFKGINKNAKIKVPSSKLKKYKKLMNKKGQKSTVKIIKK